MGKDMAVQWMRKLEIKDTGKSWNPKQLVANISVSEYQNIKVRLKVLMISRESKLYELGLMLGLVCAPLVCWEAATWLPPGWCVHVLSRRGFCPVISVSHPVVPASGNLSLSLILKCLLTCSSDLGLIALFFCLISFPAYSSCKDFLSTNITFLSWPYELCRGHPQRHGKTFLTMT